MKLANGIKTKSSKYLADSDITLNVPFLEKKQAMSTETSSKRHLFQCCLSNSNHEFISVFFYIIKSDNMISRNVEKVYNILN